MCDSTKRLLFLALCLSLLVSVTANASAVLPPKYLGVADFQKCLATKNMGTWSAWCMPASKPASCPDDSWTQLNGLTEKDRVPGCP